MPYSAKDVWAMSIYNQKLVYKQILSDEYMSVPEVISSRVGINLSPIFIFGT